MTRVYTSGIISDIGGLMGMMMLVFAISIMMNIMKEPTKYIEAGARAAGEFTGAALGAALFV